MRTVANWYRSAFKLIFGHEFTPKLWISSMGIQQVSEAFGEPSAVLLERVLRAAQSNPRTVNESSLTRGAGDFVESLPADEGFDTDAATRRIVDMIDEGLSNERICDDMELDRRIIPVVAYLRTHRDLTS